MLDGGNTLFSGRRADLSNLIDDLVVEFSSTAPMMDIKKVLMSIPHYRSLYATETGFIAVFNKYIDLNGSSRQKFDFNTIIKILGQDCPGELSYARDISNSCRILFEPRLSEWLNPDGANR